MKFYLRLAALVCGFLLVLWLLQEYRNNAPAPSVASATPTPAPTPVPAVTVTPAPVPRDATSSIHAKINRAAQAARVRVAGVRNENDWFVVTVQAAERNPLGEFLDHARANGMRDVDLNRSGYRQFMQQGRTIHQDTYRMKF